MKQQIEQIIRAALTAVSPGEFIPRIMKVEGERLLIGGQTFELSRYRNIQLISIGKAGLTMAESTAEILGEYLNGGIVLTKHTSGHSCLPGNFQIRTGGHPIPTQDSLNATQEIFTLLGGMGADDLALFLISGGASALLSMPQDGVSLADWQIFSALLLGSGADIREFNTLRKHLDRAKGGGLALQAFPAERVSIILSDVVGSPLDVIASGPTIPDQSFYADAWAVLEKYQLTERMPASISPVLRRGMRGELPETLKAEDPRCALIHSFLAADNRLAAEAAARKAIELGFNAAVLSTRITGEAACVGALLPALLSEVDQKKSFLRRPAVMILGGETTVQLHGKGKGGRNQELALGAVRGMAELKNAALISLATDGEDGPTDAAGAIVTEHTLEEGLAKGMLPEDYLRNNDAWHYFETLGALIKTGPSGTNVNDLCFLIAF